MKEPTRDRYSGVPLPGTERCRWRHQNVADGRHLNFPGVDPKSADAGGTDATVLHVQKKDLRNISKKHTADNQRQSYSKISNPAALLVNPSQAKQVCKGIKRLSYCATGSVEDKAPMRNLANAAKQVNFSSGQVNVFRGRGDGRSKQLEPDAFEEAKPHVRIKLESEFPPGELPHDICKNLCADGSDFCTHHSTNTQVLKAPKTAYKIRWESEK